MCSHATWEKGSEITLKAHTQVVWPHKTCDISPFKMDQEIAYRVKQGTSAAKNKKINKNNKRDFRKETAIWARHHTSAAKTGEWLLLRGTSNFRKISGLVLLLASSNHKEISSPLLISTYSCESWGVAIRPVFPTQLHTKVTSELKNTDSWAMQRKALAGRDVMDPGTIWWF